MRRVRKLHNLNRRQFVVLGGSAAGASLLSACGAQPQMSSDMQAPDFAVASCAGPAGVDVPDANRLTVGQVLQVTGRQLFIHRDSRGFMAISAYCTHASCEVKLNSQDRTYDCDCHGSRFELDGRVRKGPATRPLQHKAMCREEGILKVNVSVNLPGTDSRYQ